MTAEAIPTIDVSLASPSRDPGHDRVLDQLCINTIRTLAMDAVAGAKIGMHTFGSSAPLKDLLQTFGFTPEKVLAAAKEQIAKARGKP